MVLSTFNHIQGNNGSHWNRLMRGANAEKICIVAIDAATAGFEKLVKEIEQAREGYGFEEVVVGIETTGH
ncbi:hypothetical protein ACQKDD_17590, partial [Planococcus kocurii]